MSKRKNDDDIFLDRRTLLRIGASGFMAALIARAGLAKSDPSAAPSLPAAKAKACILLWLNGGPSHIDTFDPKPGKSTGGPFKAIKTKAPAVELCEHLPLLAEEAHRIAVLRGMTSREGNHQRAQFLVHTGYAPSTDHRHPSLGAWTSSRLGAKDAELPAFVSVGGTELRRWVPRRAERALRDPEGRRRPRERRSRARRRPGTLRSPRRRPGHAGVTLLARDRRRQGRGSPRRLRQGPAPHALPEAQGLRHRRGVRRGEELRTAAPTSVAAVSSRGASSRTACASSRSSSTGGTPTATTSRARRT